MRHVFAFDAQGLVHRHQRAFEHAALNRHGRRHIAHGFGLNHGVAHDKGLRVLWHQGIATWEFEFFIVPRRNRRGFVRQEPSLGRSQHLIGGHNLLNQAQLQALGGVELLAFHQVRRSALNAQGANQALRAARAWQQADHHFGQTQADAGVISAHAVMAGQGDFKTAAQGNAVDGSCHGLAAGFHAAQDARQRSEFIKRFFDAVVHHLVKIGLHGLQIGTRNKGVFAAGDDDAFNRSIRSSFFYARAQAIHQGLVDDIHALTWVINGESGNAVCIDGVFHNFRHGFFLLSSYQSIRLKNERAFIRARSPWLCPCLRQRRAKPRRFFCPCVPAHRAPCPKSWRRLRPVDAP